MLVVPSLLPEAGAMLVHGILEAHSAPRRAELSVLKAPVLPASAAAITALEALVFAGEL